MSGTAIASLDMVRRLVGYDTTSRLSNLALIEFVRDYLDGHGVRSELMFDETGQKANLYATIGPEEGGGIMLSGHTDVVPVDGQEWRSDPFVVVAREDQLYGRGTADMKSFIAVVLTLLPELRVRDLRIPLHLAFSYDEEIGCYGARRLVAALADRPDRPRLCIVGEPTSMQPVTGHKGKHSYRCQVHGFECHSALAHLGVNAVEAAAELVAQLKAMARRKREAGPFDPDYAPPYTTIHTGTISGGTALNIVPKDCSFDFEYRLLPADDPEAPIRELRAFAEDRLLPEMRAVQPQTSIRFRGIVGLSRSRHAGRRRDHPARRLAYRRQRHWQGQFRHRGGAFSPYRHPDSDLWSGLDRTGAQARRVHRSRPDRAMRDLHPPTVRAFDRVTRVTAAGIGCKIAARDPIAGAPACPSPPTPSS